MFERSELEARIPGVVYLPACESTNRVARSLPVGGIVVADHQTAGRGRLGRTWLSPPGDNLLVSFVLSAPADPAHAPRMCLLWAAALAEVLDVSVKWPNDLVDAEGSKLGGLLAELESEHGVRRIVLGLGLNVNQRSFPADLSSATSLCLLRGGPLDRLDVLCDVVDAVRGVSADEDLGRWRRRSITIGRRVEVLGRTGVAEAVREDGALIVDGEAVLAGDVHLVG